MPAYKDSKEYWEIAEARYAGFASPEDEVEVVNSYNKTGGTCNLCDHDISNHYVIKNHRTGRTMEVGSNCIHNRVRIEQKWRAKIRKEREEADGQSDFTRAGETTIVKRYNQFRNLPANRGHVK
jgi:hypothetical protein